MTSSATAELTILVLLLGLFAALLSALGPLLARRAGLSGRFELGWSHAVASGMMIGVSYALMVEAIELSSAVAVLSALAGAAYTYWSRRYAGLDDQKKPTTIALLLQNTLHSASEGIAIGAAVAFDLRAGLFAAVSLALHNVAEAIVLARRLSALGHTRLEATRYSVAINLSQPLLAVLAFSLTQVLPSSIPAALGFASGALIFLVIAESLPQAYQHERRTQVALLISVAAGGVVLFRGLIGGQ